MSELQRYPALKALLGDLRVLSVAEAVVEARQRRQGLKVEAGRDLVRVEWQGETYWFTGAQREVVRLLLDAAVNSATPDVDESVLLRRSMAPGVRRLAHLFRDHAAWGTLILPGARPATYRIALPEGDDDQGGEDVRVEAEG